LSVTSFTILTEKPLSISDRNANWMISNDKVYKIVSRGRCGTNVRCVEPIKLTKCEFSCHAWQLTSTSHRTATSILVVHRVAANRRRSVDLSITSLLTKYVRPNHFSGDVTRRVYTKPTKSSTERPLQPMTAMAIGEVIRATALENTDNVQE